MPEVSIITPCYNSEEFIYQTLHSVKLQRYKDFEHIIVIDEDNPVRKQRLKEIISEFDHKIKVIETAGKTGASNSRNIGIKESRGNYLAFLDSDDSWHPDKLGLQINFMKKNNISISHSNYAQVDENGDYVKNRLSPKKISYNSLLISPRIGCLTVIAKKALFDHTEPFPNFPCRNDYAAWLKIFKKASSFNCNEILAFYRVRRGSISSNSCKNIKGHYDVLNKQEGYPPPITLFFIFSNFFIKFLDLLFLRR